MNSTIPPLTTQLPSYEQLAIAYVLMAQKMANSDGNRMGSNIIVGLRLAQRKMTTDTTIAPDAIGILSDGYAIALREEGKKSCP